MMPLSFAAASNASVAVFGFANLHSFTRNLNPLIKYQIRSLFHRYGRIGTHCNEVMATNLEQRQKVEHPVSSNMRSCELTPMH